MAIPERFVDELVARTDIVDLVSEYVRLNKKGRNYWGLCPFHSEKTPSFSVSADKQIYKCFGCGKGGGAINFVMDEEKGTLCPPFSSVAGLGETAAVALQEACRGKQFISIEEVTNACSKISKTHVAQLKDAGAFGDLPDTSQINLFSMF